MENAKRKKIALAVVIIIAAAITINASVTVVAVGEIGVVKTLGAPTGATLANGWHFKIPFIQRVEDVDIKILKQQVVCKAVSRDMQTVSSEVAVNYRVDPASAVEIVRTIGAAMYEDKLLSPAIQESVKLTTAKYTAEGLITEREKVRTEIEENLKSKMERHGIIVDGFNIVNFDFSDAFNSAIEEKQVAQQDLIRVETEQKQLIVKAEAAAKAAEAEAQAILVKAEAQAEANRKLAASLTAVLVEYEKIQKWDGKLPQVSGGNAIVDIR